MRLGNFTSLLNGLHVWTDIWYSCVHVRKKKRVAEYFAVTFVVLWVSMVLHRCQWVVFNVLTDIWLSCVHVPEKKWIAKYFASIFVVLFD